VQTLTYNFTGPTTLTAVNILTTGAPGLDYSDGGGSTCTAGVTYGVTLPQSCVVTVAFTPSAPGLRSGGVTLFAQGATLPLQTWYLSGVGQSSAVTIDPGTQTTLTTLGNSGQAYGSAIDGAGNLYLVDHANSAVIELAAGTFAPTTVVSSGLLNPTAVALDGAGNLYISDTGNNRVVMVPDEQGTLNVADRSVVAISGLGSPRGISVDGGGNLYVADATHGNVVEVPAGGGVPSNVATGLTAPHGVAVDALGNVYVTSNNQVSQYPVGGGSAVPYGTGYSNPRGIAVDASGTVYVADSGNNQIVVVAPGGGSQTNGSTLPATSPQGVTVDAAANIYVTVGGSIYEVNRSLAATLTFASTNIGSTSAAQVVSVTDAGNQGLSVSNLVVSTNFTQLASGGTDCSSSTALASAGQCLIAVAFAPTASGTLPGSVTLTDNALNNLASSQAVPLSGTGALDPQTITFPAIGNQTYGVAPITLGATASSGLTVSYAVTLGPANISNGNVLTITGAGSVTVVASQGGDGVTWAAATPVPQTITVSPEGQTITFTNPGPQAFGTSPTLSASSTSNLPVSFVPITPSVCTVTGNAVTFLNTGNCTIQATQAGNTNYLPATPVPQTFKVIPGTQIITFATIPATTLLTGSFTLSPIPSVNTGLPDLGRHGNPAGHWKLRHHCDAGWHQPVRCGLAWASVRGDACRANHYLPADRKSGSWNQLCAASHGFFRPAGQLHSPDSVDLHGDGKHGHGLHRQPAGCWHLRHLCQPGWQRHLRGSAAGRACLPGHASPANHHLLESGNPGGGSGL
jgi:sugar lactone lactonase YvrE